MSITGCTPTVPTPGVVVFDPAAFQADYPSFSTVSTGALNFNFSLAELQLNNTCGSRICDAPTRQTLLGLLTAHITALLNGVNGQPPAGIAGRISDAQEGSVSVSFEFTAPTTSQLVASLQTTQWGLMFLAATAKYRTMQYVVPPPVFYNPYGYGPAGAFFGGFNGYGY